jgi:5-methylcytosine-specific restriction endonuclease McrA
MKHFIANESDERKETTNDKSFKVWKGRTPNPSYFSWKKCRICEETKPLDDFHSNPEMHDGRLSQCKVCQAKLVRKNQETPTGHAAMRSAQRRYSKSPLGRFATVKASHKERGGGKITMTQEEFGALLENQTECAICNKPFTKTDPPFTDHIIAIKNKEGKPSPLSG